MNYPKISIIILNWNGYNDTINCLKSLQKITYRNFNIILVDNGSQNNEGIRIKHEFGPFIHLILTYKNTGFSTGNNIGIRYALKTTSKYILLLNNDTIVKKNFLNELVKTIESNKNIGSVQSVLLKLNGKTIDSLGQELSTWGAIDKGMDLKTIKYLPQQNQEIFGACAASALYKSKMLKEIGLFDEKFFIVFEDLDLSWRIILSGHISILSSQSIVYHKRGISGKTKKSTLLKYHTTKNWVIIVIKYYPISIIFSIFIKSPQKIIGSIIILIIYTIKLKKVNECFILLRKNFKKRREIQKNIILKSTIQKWTV